MDEKEKKRVATAIKSYIAAKNISRPRFALQAKVSISLLDKMLAGKFTDKGLTKVESNIGVRFRSHQIIRKQAPDRLGGYSYDEVREYEGYYEFIRYGFQAKGVIHCYAAEIRWSEEDACLVVQHLGIKESQFRQAGLIAKPDKASFVYVVSEYLNGYHSMMILTAYDYTKVMRGILFGLGNMGPTLIPVVAPVVFKRVDNPAQTREIAKKSSEYSSYHALLEEARSPNYTKSFF